MKIAPKQLPAFTDFDCCIAVVYRYRLAFREFGTTLGVQCNPEAQSTWAERVVRLNKFWEPRVHDRDQDITPVMYCASLNPGVFLRDYPILSKQA